MFMSASIIIGGQWGDEGKGKLVDFLSQQTDLVARYQGGANAGHTVYLKNQKYVFHLIPGGILWPKVVCLIGNGVVFDPESFFQEVDLLNRNGIDIRGRLFISDRAHLIVPYHKLLDQAREKELQTRKIGTTGRGIGPAYVDKYDRCGIRLVDLYDQNLLREKLTENLEIKNRLLVEAYHQTPLNFQEVYDTLCRCAEKLREFVTDTSWLLYRAWQEHKKILLEGAQGSLLDVDFGSYPFVTSSHPTCGGALCGTGLPLIAVKDIIGVFKAYTTRVGSGPFPSEDKTQDGIRLRDVGSEYGATTGRPRRCGWFDVVAAQFAARINGLTSVALTKLDVLDKFETVRVCTAYRYQNQTLTQFPANTRILDTCQPVYTEIPGWQESIAACRKFDKLPAATRKYVQYLEEAIGVPVKYISVGVEREAMIII
jgi:adenylosuccinate synthase